MSATACPQRRQRAENLLGFACLDQIYADRFMLVLDAGDPRAKLGKLACHKAFQRFAFIQVQAFLREYRAKTVLYLRPGISGRVRATPEAVQAVG